MAGPVVRSHGNARRVWTGAVLIVLALALLPVMPAQALHYQGTRELEAANAQEAAIAFATLAFPSGAEEAVLGRADVFADSLASGALQSTRPLLLTPGDALDPDVAQALDDLGVETVHLLGGLAALSQEVEDALVEAGYTVSRHAGSTRVDTAVEIAKAVDATPTAVLIARAFAGQDDPTQAFADSLSAGAWAAQRSRPILLTETEQLSAATEAFLTEAAPEEAFVIGGTAAISEAAAGQIEALGITVQRVSGPTRFDTAVAVATERGIRDGNDTGGFVLVDGQTADGWVSGFAAAAYAADNDAPVLLSTGDTLPEATETFFTGGDDRPELLCAPSASEAACTAAAELLDKTKNLAVELSSNTVAEYGSLAGTITPAERIQSVEADGCGLQDQEVIVDQDGAFSVRVPGPAGECDLRVTVTDTDGGVVAPEFALTVTEGAPATELPELQRAEVEQLQASYVEVRFVFSRPVHAIMLDEATDGHTKFLLYGPRPDTDLFTALGGEDEEHKPRRDTGDSRSVFARFSRTGELGDPVDIATTAGVLGGAVNGVDTGTRPNPPGSAPLQEITYPGARTFTDTDEDALDLTTVGTATAQGAPPGRFRVPFTYDVAPDDTTAPEAADHVVVLDDGRGIPATEVFISGTQALGEFDPDDARDADGTVCTEDDCPTLQQAISGVRRGYVTLGSGATLRIQSAPVVSEGLTTAPDLTEVSLDLDADTATFTFDQSIDSQTLDVTRFALYERYGGALTPTEAVKSGTDAVEATFAEGSLHKGIVGAYVAAQAVKGGGVDAEAAAVALSPTLDAGETFAPKLLIARSVLLSSSGDGTRQWQIEFVFDQPVGQPVQDALTTYEADGDEILLDTCALVEDDDTTVRCETGELTSDVGEPVLAVADSAAVRGTRQVFGTQYDNVPRAVRL